MNYLLFWVCSIFAFIFHFFHTRSIGKDIFFDDFPQGKLDVFISSQNLFIASISFLFLWMALYIIFSQFDQEKKEQPVPKLSFWDIKNILWAFFKKYLYYAGFIFFYLSIYIILHQFWVSFSYCIFIISIIIFWLFFAASNFYIFRDFIKVNTILFSIYYIADYILNFSLGQVTFIEIDFINSFLVLVFFVLTIYSDNFLLKKPHSDTPLVVYFFVYLFLFVSFYSYIVFWSVHFTFAVLWFLFSVFCYYIAPDFILFKNATIALRYLSLFFSYISILSSVSYHLLKSFHLVIIVLLLTWAYFNFDIHKKYSNFVSLWFSFLAFWWAVFSIFFEFVFPSFINPQTILVLSFIFAILAILFPIFSKSKEIMEHYFFHIFSYLINFFWVCAFFYFNWFDILAFWVILFIESIFVFFSYYKINSLR